MSGSICNMEDMMKHISDLYKLLKDKDSIIEQQYREIAKYQSMLLDKKQSTFEDMFLIYSTDLEEIDSIKTIGNYLMEFGELAYNNGHHLIAMQESNRNFSIYLASMEEKSDLAATIRQVENLIQIKQREEDFENNFSKRRNKPELRTNLENDLDYIKRNIEKIMDDTGIIREHKILSGDRISEVMEEPSDNLLETAKGLMEETFQPNGIFGEEEPSFRPQEFSSQLHFFETQSLPPIKFTPMEAKPAEVNNSTTIERLIDLIKTNLISIILYISTIFQSYIPDHPIFGVIRSQVSVFCDGAKSIISLQTTMFSFILHSLLDFVKHVYSNPFGTVIFCILYDFLYDFFIVQNFDPQNINA